MPVDNSSGRVHADTMQARRTKGTRGGWRPGAGRPAEVEDAVTCTFEVSRRHVATLTELAAERDVSRAALIRQAIASFLARQRRR